MESAHRGRGPFASCAHSILPFALGLLAISPWGCSTVDPIFAPVDPPIVWPPTADQPKFTYVGQISGEADLKPPRSVWYWIGAVFAGHGEEVRLQGASSAVLTPSEVLYVADPGAGVVHRFDLKSRRYATLRSAGEAQSFVTPIGLALLGERLVVSDRSLGALTVLSPEGNPQEVLGKGALVAPVGIAVGPISKRLYVADVAAHQVKVLGQDGSLLFAVGGRGRGPSEFNFPTHVACDASENLYVSDSLNFRVQAFDPRGSFLRSWGEKGDGPGDFSQPKGIAVDRRGLVYVVDSRFENFQVFDPEGRLLLAVGEEGTEPGQFWLPTGIFVDTQDRIWVADWFNQRVQVFKYIGDEVAGVEP